MSGGFGAGSGGRFGRRRAGAGRGAGGFGGGAFGGGSIGGGSADIVPRRRGALAWERPEPALFGLDGRRDLLLKLDAALANTGERALTVLDARLLEASPAWDAPRAEWYENGDVRRAVFRVAPWLPCTLEAGVTRASVRLVWVVPRDSAPARGVARLPLVLSIDDGAELRFEVLATVPEGFERRR